MIKREEKETNKKPSKINIEEALLDNFITLQKVLTNLAIKFDDLSNSLEKFIQLFEITAKSFAEKQPIDNDTQRETDKKLIEKLDNLLDQNKTISKGIMLMEERIRNRINPSMPIESQFQTKPRPLPKF